MSINSITFLFWFLPIFIVVFFICKLSLRGSLVLLASLFVYAWGSYVSLLLLLAFTLANYFFGLELGEHKNTLSLFVILDVLFLCMFKYTSVGSGFGIDGMPLGISFYVFSAISYLFDVARADTKAEKNIAKLALYICMFPRINMGPIVKYKNIADDLDNLNPTSQQVSDGVVKFCIGLFKKTVIASFLSEITELCWLDAGASLASAWLGIITFCLELYYDFSGYSDMAIGLGKMLGWEFGENFIYPFEASSISDFWRRWHASLGAWFKDYVYIPLGGNRKSGLRTMLNILTVWLFTGMWHGADFSFIAWGLSVGILICIEKPIIKRIKVPYCIGLLYTLPAFILTMVFFNADDIYSAIEYFTYLFGNNISLRSAISDRFYYDDLALLLVCALGTTSLPKYYASQIFTKDDGSDSVGTMIVKTLFVLALLVCSTMYIVKAGYTPFMYGTF